MQDKICTLLNTVFFTFQMTMFKKRHFLAIQGCQTYTLYSEDLAWISTAFPNFNNVANLPLPLFLAMSDPVEERLMCSTTGGRTIPLGFALPVSSQMRQKQIKN